MHGLPRAQPGPQPPARLPAPGRPKAGRRRYKTFMIDEILSKETCDYFEKLSLYSVCPSLVVRPKPLHSCAGKRGPAWRSRGARASGSCAFPCIPPEPCLKGARLSRSIPAPCVCQRRDRCWLLSVTSSYQLVSHYQVLVTVSV